MTNIREILEKLWGNFNQSSSGKFNRRATKDFVAIYFPEGKQEDLAELFPETVPTAEKVGQFNQSV